MLGNGTIVTFQSYDVADFRQILGGVYKSNSVEITGHIAFPISDGTGSNKVPVVIIIHSSGGPTEITDGWKNWFRDIQQPLLKSGIGVFYIDSFSARGVKHTYEDQYKASIISQSIDTVMAYKFLKDHPRVNADKIGVTGSSRGGTISFMVANKKFTNHFLSEGEGFAAILPMSAECRISGLFENPEMTKNSKMLVVQGSLDGEVESCKKYAEKIKTNRGEVKVDLKEGWHHHFMANHKVESYPVWQFNNCSPYYYTKDNGDINDEMMNFLLVKRKLWSSKENYYNDAYENPQKTFNKMVKNLVKSKCAKKGVPFGGKHGKEFTPQFLGFFTENLL